MGFYSGYMPVLRVDPDEAGALLVGLGPQSFDQFELLPVDEGAVLLPPLSDAPRSARVQAGDVPATNKVTLASSAADVCVRVHSQTTFCWTGSTSEAVHTMHVYTR